MQSAVQTKLFLQGVQANSIIMTVFGIILLAIGITIVVLTTRLVLKQDKETKQGQNNKTDLEDYGILASYLVSAMAIGLSLWMIIHNVIGIINPYYFIHR